MKEIYINADDYNSDSIRTIQGNNNAEEYKIYLQYDNEKIDLTGKTVNLGFLKVGSTEGDIIENLNVTNPKEGEITLKITNKISKRNGTYSCQLAILGEGDFLEHTATFTLTVENNIFSDITKAIADSKDFTYLENILDKASKLSEKLKENTSSATNANSNLESNIIEANNINSKLLENTSTATSLNKNLESNINLAKEVKETIKDLDTKNIEATSKIERLEGLNAKAEELSNNINEALPVKDALVKNTESAKVANTNLLATNQEATTKNTELQASLEKTKEFINGLDGSQNIPQLRLDVTELQNGLKSNQALEYQGSSISADNTLEGRTEGMKIKGKTMYKKKDGTYTDTWEEGVTLESFGEAEGNKISILSNNENYFKLTNDNIFGIGTTVTVNGNSFTTTTTNGWNQGFGIQVDRIPSGKYKTVFEVIENKDKGVLYEIEYFKDNNSIKTMPLNYVQYEGIINVENIDYDYFKLKFKNGREQSPIGYKYLMLVPYDSNINTYVEKKSDKKDILIKEPLREGDYLYEDNGQVKVYRDVKQYTFTGDENISNDKMTVDETNSTTIGFSILMEKSLTTNANTSIMCNNFITKGVYGLDQEGIYQGWGKVLLRINKSKLTTPDVNGFKAWLKANPTTIVYQLATPTVEIVENCVDIDLDTFGEKTYFNIENSIKGSLDFKVPSNIASIVQSTAREVNNIWDVINNLLVPSLIDINKNVAMSTIKNNLK